jgi:hypothetical protein
LVLWPHYSVGTVGVCWGYGQQPETRVGSKYLLEILVGAYIVDIGPSVGVTLPFEVVKSGGVGEYEFDVESEEHAYNDKESSFDEYANGSNDEGNGDGIGFVDDSHNVLYEERYFASEGEDEGEYDVEEK